jgi:hypothetical protein
VVSGLSPVSEIVKTKYVRTPSTTVTFWISPVGWPCKVNKDTHLERILSNTRHSQIDCVIPAVRSSRTSVLNRVVHTAEPVKEPFLLCQIRPKKPRKTCYFNQDGCDVKTALKVTGRTRLQFMMSQCKGIKQIT